MEHAPELGDLTLQLYQAMGSGDIPFCERLASRQKGPLGIGTDPRERWPDYASLVGAFRAPTAGVGGCFPVTPGDPQAYREGTVGWVADRAIRLPGQPADPVPPHHPGVAVLRASRDRLRADQALVAAYVARKRAIIGAGITDGGPTPARTMSPGPPSSGGARR